MTNPILPTQLPDDALGTVYCNDEHIAIKAPQDYAILCPDSNKLAVAIDGFIAAATPWRLSSPSADFVAAGVTRGNVIMLTAPVTQFPGTGEQLAVESVEKTSLILRRVGQQAGVGQPPGTRTNLNGIHYTVQTYGPQIDEVSYYLNRMYAIDPSIPARNPSRLYEIRDLRDACVLTVIVRRLVTEVNPSAGANATRKLDAYRAELETVMNRLQIRWQPSTTGDMPTTNPFSTRLVR